MCPSTSQLDVMRCPSATSQENYKQKGNKQSFKIHLQIQLLDLYSSDHISRDLTWKAFKIEL